MSEHDDASGPVLPRPLPRSGGLRAPSVGLDLSTRLEPDFAHVHAEARMSVSFVRTLRLPYDGRPSIVPSALGPLPLGRMRDLARPVPSTWRRERGALLPMYRSEAVRLIFDAPTRYPFAVKILADGLNLVSGRPWRPGLDHDRTNYLVVPGRNHLDGLPGEHGRVRQLVAAPLDPASAARGPLDDAGPVRQLQFVVTPLDPVRWTLLGPYPWRGPRGCDPTHWDERHTQTSFVGIVPAHRWEEVTGELVPHPPISGDLYHGAGVPWCESFRADRVVPNAGLPLRDLDEPAWGRTA